MTNFKKVAELASQADDDAAVVGAMLMWDIQKAITDSRKGISGIPLDSVADAITSALEPEEAEYVATQINRLVIERAEIAKHTEKLPF